MRIVLTDIAIRKLQPPERGQLKVWDTNLPGFGLVVGKRSKTFTVKRRHTPKARRDLPALVAEIVEPLGERRQRQHEQFARYKSVELDDRDADHLIMQLYRRGVINVQRIANVLGEWENPTHDWGNKTVWRAFNAVTFALTGRMAETPEKSERLHETIDAVI